MGLLNLMLAFHGGWGWQNFFGLAVFGCFVGIPGVIRWVGAAETGSSRSLRAGPALLIPAVVLWTLISHYSCSHEVECRDDSWRIVPFYGAVAAAAFWNVALIVARKERPYFDWLHAIIFLPSFYWFCMLALALAIKFPL